MVTDDVIILSSPDASASTSSCPSRRNRKGSSHSAPSVIEISDSDSDSDNDHARSNEKRAPVKTHSRELTEANTSQSAETSSKSRISDKGKGKQPLFLPSNNEGEAEPTSDHEVESISTAYLLKHKRDAILSMTLDSPPITVGATPVPSQPHDPTDPFDEFLAQVLEIVPDVEPTYAMNLLRAQHPTSGPNIVAIVLHSLLEGAYPKSDRKGKRKRSDQDEEEPLSQRSKVDYASKDRPFKGGPQYYELALEQLMVDFPLIPKAHIRKIMLSNSNLYAPSHLALASESALPRLPYQKKSQPYRPKGKGPALSDQEYAHERAWLLLKLQDEKVEKDRVLAEKTNEQQYEECGDGIECGCCFSVYPFDVMVQCPDAHLFCKTCMIGYAEIKLGEHNPNLVCMDQSGCKLCFSDSELRRFLTPKLLELYERVKQRKEIEAAGIDGLEECPFCEYKVVIENEQEKLFRCERAECGAVSCRQCKKLDHLPKTCQEADSEKHLDGQHAIEEAMTRALMRNCPKCQKAFIKDFGCNKMTCPNCGTLSCYTCRQAITGYDHFQQPGPSGSSTSKKCLLWDNVESRHADEVNAAAKRAIEEYKRENPDVTDKDLNVQLAQAPPPAQAAPIPVHGFGPMRYPQMPAQPRPMHRLPAGHAHGAYLQAFHNLNFQRPILPPLPVVQQVAAGPPVAPAPAPPVHPAPQNIPVPAPYVQPRVHMPVPAVAANAMMAYDAHVARMRQAVQQQRQMNAAPVPPAPPAVRDNARTLPRPIVAPRTRRR